jgi:hypothetical protein
MYCLSNINTEFVVGGIAPVNTTPPGLDAEQTEAAEKAQAELVSGLVDFAVGLWDGLTK